VYYSDWVRVLQKAKYLFKYGKQLVEHAPAPTTDLLLRVTGDGSQHNNEQPQLTDGRTILDAFIDQPRTLRTFLERAVKQHVSSSTPSDKHARECCTLLELYLRDYEHTPTASSEKQLLEYIRQYVCVSDGLANAAMMLCETFHFTPGILLLLDKLKR
jgi:hypothetical protein